MPFSVVKSALICYVAHCTVSKHQYMGMKWRGGWQYRGGVEGLHLRLRRPAIEVMKLSQNTKVKEVDDTHSQLKGIMMKSNLHVSKIVLLAGLLSLTLTACNRGGGSSGSDQSGGATGSPDSTQTTPPPSSSPSSPGALPPTSPETPPGAAPSSPSSGISGGATEGTSESPGAMTPSTPPPDSSGSSSGGSSDNGSMGGSSSGSSPSGSTTEPGGRFSQ